MQDTIKLYKFRPLQDEKDFERAKHILETNHFWCSKFSELNDPMEGVFLIAADAKSRISEIFGEKERYNFCAFAGEKGFENPLMWGYYANGFKGIAIEIEIARSEVEKIEYSPSIPSVEGPTDIKAILTTKLEYWKHEDEYRFLTEGPKGIKNNEYKIGTIKAVYFGDPYGNIVNEQDVLDKSKTLSAYRELRKRLSEVADGKGFRQYFVKIENGKVIRVPARPVSLIQ